MGGGEKTSEEERRRFVSREDKNWGISTSFYRQTFTIFSYIGYEYCIVVRRCVSKFEACAERNLKDISTSFFTFQALPLLRKTNKQYIVAKG